MCSVVVYVFIIITCIKILLIPSYSSTDFEVHRNWLATTYTLPINQWYTATHSEWTLDYPPLFAWFEYILAHIAVYVDNHIVDIHAHNYYKYTTILFQRFSVIATDAVLAFAVYKYCSIHSRVSSGIGIISFVVLCHPALLLVDHVHFQYNGMLLGILILSCTYIQTGHNDILGGVLFAVLLCFKHIFLYIAPVYFVYLLRHYCMHTHTQQNITTNNTLHEFIWRLFKLGCAVLSVFVITLVPWMYSIGDVFVRLFPFQRGLSHAYWAPNIWAIYNTIDRVAYAIARRLGYNSITVRVSSTSGLVSIIDHAILPSVTPTHTAILTLATMAPALYNLWKYPHPKMFIPSLLYCSMCSYMFGWHVHEKAILLIVLPFAAICTWSTMHTTYYIILSYCSTISIFPLLFTHTEAYTKFLVCTVYHVIAYMLLYTYQQHHNKSFNGILNINHIIYLSASIPTLIITNIILPCYFPQLEFAPLLCISVYCAVGMVYIWMKLFTCIHTYQHHAPQTQNKDA